MCLRFGSFLGVAVLFALAFAAGPVEGNAAGHVIEVTVADLADDPETAENAKTAREKVQARIDGAEAGDVVRFPDGAFEDVGELLFSVDGGEGEGEEIVIRGNVEDPSAVVFTGKIMFNVMASNLVIEGFTFRDTNAPDRLTRKRQDRDADDSNDDQYVRKAPHDHRVLDSDAATVLINTLYLGGASCPVVDGKPDFDKLIKNVGIRNNVFRNTELFGVQFQAGFGVTGAARCGSSDMVISGNTFAGIGFNGPYIDRERNIRGWDNLESAIRTVFPPNRMTVTDNVIDGTTYAGIMLNKTYGKTVVRHNEVKNVPAYGIRVRGNKDKDSDYEVVVSDNKVSNTNNDLYSLKRYKLYKEHEVVPFKRANPGFTDRQVDRILKPEIWRVSPGADFRFGDTGAPRPVSDLADTEYDGSGNRVAATASRIPQTDGGLGAGRPCGPAGADSMLERWDTGAVEADDQWCYSLVRFIDPALEAAIILAGVTAETIKVENNEITGNALGILICKGSSCAFRDPFNDLGSPVEASRIPTVIRGNNIYDNGNRMSSHVPPASYAWGEAVNALEGGDNELDLSGNYLGRIPRVRGNVKRLGNSALAASAFDLSAAGPRASANDRTGPSVTGTPAVDGAVLTIEYDETLGGDPLPAAFTVESRTSADAGRFLRIGVSGVDVSGTTVTLTLARAVPASETVTVTYDRSKAGENPLSDASVGGNAAAGFSDMEVTNRTDGGAGRPGDGPGDRPGDAGPGISGGGGGGCALASAGSEGVDLGTLLPLMLAGLAFGRMRRRPEEPL